MKPCRDCGHEVSEQAFQCPHCGAPYPARARFDGFGWEYRSKATLLGLPLVHVSFKYRLAPPRPVVAKGWLAVGQFAAGVVTVAQFGVGLVTLGQFAVGGWVLAQFAAGWSILAQMGLYLGSGRGQKVANLLQLLGLAP
jgi:hypothetical protein